MAGRVNIGLMMGETLMSSNTLWPSSICQAVKHFGLLAMGWGVHRMTGRHIHTMSLYCYFAINWPEPCEASLAKMSIATQRHHVFPGFNLKAVALVERSTNESGQSHGFCPIPAEGDSQGRNQALGPLISASAWLLPMPDAGFEPATSCL